MWTSAAGALPIEQLQADQYVLAADGGGEIGHDGVGIQDGLIGATIVRENAPLLHVTIEHDAGVAMPPLTGGELETLETTDEHPFWVIGRGWTHADSLRPGDRLATLVEGDGGATVLASEFTDERTTVYNLTIPASPTYFVGDSGVWVHNCVPTHLLETAFQSFRSRSPHEVSGYIDDLVQAGWKRRPARSGNGFVIENPKVPGNNIRYHLGGSRSDADHLYGRPYWVYSRGGNDGFKLKFEAGS